MQVNIPHKGQLIVASRTPKALATKVTTTTVQRSSLPKRPRRKRRKVTVSRSLSQPGGGPMMQSYFRCLMDPFNNPPVRLGYGTMVPTQLHTAYLRTSITTSVAGNLNVFVLPNPNNFILLSYANGPSVSPTISSAKMSPSANVALLNSMYDMTRTVAMGLRIYPMVPATSVPGIVALGCAPRSDLTDFVAPTLLSPPGTNLANASSEYVFQMPYMREHMAKPSNLDYYQVTWRPTDVKDFEFHMGDHPVIHFNVDANSAPFLGAEAVANHSVDTTTDTQGSFLVASIQGLPINTTVYFEAVLHMETIDATNPIASTEFSASNGNIDNVADENPLIPTIESLYRSVKGYLPSVDTVMGAASSLVSSPIVRQTVSRYANNYLMGVRATGYELV